MTIEPGQHNSVTAGTATGSGTDYTLASGTTTILAGTTTANITFAINDDSATESTENFTITLGTITGTATMGLVDDHAVSIIDNDFPALTISDVSGVEGTSLTFTVTASSTSTSNITFSYASADSTATSPTNYTAVSGSGTITAGQTTTTIVVSTVNTAGICEGDRTFDVVLSSPANATIGDATGVGTIQDNDYPSISIANASATEGSSLTVEATLSAACPSSNITFAWSNSSSTATSGADFTGVTSQTLTIVAGVTTANLITSTTQDTLDENNETFNVSIASPVNATLGTSTAVGTINDDDAAPSIDFLATAQTVAESVGTVTIASQLSTASGLQVTVPYTISGTTTAGGTDHNLANGTITIAAGSTTTNTTFTVTDDSLFEGSETLILTLGVPVNASIGTNTTHTVTITDNETQPTVQFSAATQSVSEAVGSVSFTLSLSGASSSDVTVPFTVAGTAANPADHNLSGTTLTITAGGTAVVGVFTAVDDAIDENDETVILSIGTPGNATVGTNSTQTVTIQDNDSPPSLSIDDVTLAENGGSATFTVTQSAVSGLEVTVAYAASAGGAPAAVSGTDFTATSGTLTIAAGSSVGTIVVPITDDALDESNENYVVTLSSATNSSITDATGAGVITDDDAAPSIEFSALTQSVTEAVGTVTVASEISAVSGLEVTVPFTISGTATASGTDHNLAAGTITIAAGSSTANTTFTVTNDTLYESSETVILTMGTPVNASSGTDTTHTVTITDNDTPPTLAINDVTLAENGGSATFTITQSAVSGVETTVDYATSAGGAPAATSGTDFTSTSGTATIAAGSSTATVVVPITDDAILESTENYVVTLSNPAGATISDATGAGAITDNESAPTLSIDDVTLAENGGSATFTITLSATSGLQTTVDYATSAGGAPSATSGTDFTSTSGTATIAAGSTTATVVVPIANDSLDESNENYVVTLSNPTNATISDATGAGSITDDDATPTIQFTATSQTVNENVGTVTVASELSAVSGLDATVPFTISGTATASGTDHNLAAGTITITAGSSTANTTFTVTDDTLAESSETVILTLGSPTNASAGTNTTHTVSITDNETAPTLAIDDAVVGEGAGTATFTVTLTGSTALDVTVDYATGAGSAPSATGGGTDYTNATGTLTFTAGQTEKTIVVTIAQDTLDESDENYNITLSSPANATIADATGVGQITDDDSPPTLSIDDVTLAENGGSATFTITQSAVSGLEVTVAYAAAAGSSPAAISGTDFTATSGTATIAAGSSTATVVVPITNDTIDEQDENYTVTLSSAVNASISDATGAGVITDNDATPTVQFTATSQTVSEAVGTVTVASELSAASGLEVTVPYTISGTATASGTDHNLANGTITIAAGSSTVNTTFTVTDDSLFESTETVILTLGTPVNAGAGTNTTHTASITDNDAAPSLSINSASFGEADGSVTLTVTLSTVAGAQVTVDYATASHGANQATAAADFTAISATTLTFAAGDTVKTFTTAILQDTLDEYDETYKVALSNATGGATIAVADGVVTITDDDATPTIQFTATTQSVTEAAGTVTVASEISAVAGREITVPYTVSGTATGTGTDHNLANGTITIAAGSSTVNTTFTVTDDTDFEISETVILTQGTPVNASAGTNTTHTVTITENDTAPTLAVNDVTVAEGAGSATFTVTLTGSSLVASTVAYATSDGTGTASSDYTSASGTLTFAAGETEKTVVVTILQDTLDESSETYTVTLSSPTNSTISDATGAGTITDDDAAPTIEFSSASQTVAENVGTVTVTTTLSAVSGLEATVPYTVSGTATGTGTDHNLANGTITIAAGSSTVNTTFTITNDTMYESSETVILTMGAAVNSSASGQSTHTVTVTDNDTPPTLAIDDVTLAENGGSATFTITQSAVSGVETTVDYAAAAGSSPAAVSGTDFTATSGTATIAAGSSTATVVVAITNDTLYEGSENYVVNLTNPSGATISDSQGAGTITEDDSPPTIQFAATSQSRSEAIGTVTLTTELSVASAVDTTAAFAVTGTATGSGTDHNLADGTITVTAGQTTANTTFTVTDDATAESSETVILTLSSPSGATLGTNTTHTVTILDNDTVINMVVADATATEGSTLTFTVSLDNVPSSDVTVSYATSDGSATTGGSDYSSTSGTLTIATGATVGTITVSTTSDSTPEGDESLTLTLSSATGATITDSTGTGTIDNDDITGNVWTGGDPVNNNWNDADNWADGSVPTSGETVYFIPDTCSGADCNATINSSQTVAGISIATGFTGTITQAAGQTLTVNGSISQSGGTFVGGNSNITITDNLTVSSGTFTTTAGSLFIQNNLTVNGTGAFNHNNATVVFGNNGTGAVAVSIGSTQLNNVIFQTSFSANTVTGTLDILGHLTLSGSSTSLVSGTLNVAGNLTINGNLGGSARTRLVGSTDQTVTGAASSAVGNLEILSTGGTVFLSGQVRVDNNFTYTSGNVDAGTSLMTFGQNSRGTATAVPGGIQFNNVAIEPAHYNFNLTGTLTVGGNLSAAGSGTQLNGGVIDVRGNASFSLTGGTTSIQFTGTGTQTVTQAGTLPQGTWTVNKTAGKVVQTTNITLNGSGQDLTITDGEWDMAGYNLTVSNSSGTDNVLALASGTTIYTGCGTITAETTSNGGTIVGGTSTLLSINDPAAVTEGTNSVFTVSLDAVNCANVVFNYATASGTATSGTDFTSTSGTATITAGQSSTTVTVPTTDDAVYEGATSETFNLNLTSITNTGVTDNSGVGTIDDNEAQPTVEWTAATSSVGEGDGSASITLQLNRLSYQNVVIPFTLSGTATGGGGTNDYTNPTSPVTIAAGASTANIVTTIYDDTDSDPAETIIFTIGAPTNASASGQTTHTVTITDNDATNTGAFSITGITSATDATQDAYLNGAAQPIVTWGASTNATSYDVTIYENDGTTVHCSAQNTASTSYDFLGNCSGAALTAGSTYKVKVTAKAAGFLDTDASNALYSFRYNRAPTITTSGPWYVLSGSSVTINAAYAASPVVGTAADADSDTVSFSAVGTPSSAVGSTTNNTTDVVYSASTYTGVDTFTFTVSDGVGGTVSGTMTINVVTAYTWTGGGADGDWATNSNWCGTINANQTGCANNGSEPTSSTTSTHVAIFDGTCQSNCNVTANANANYTMYGLKLNTGYAGTFTQVAKAITIGAGGYTQAAGTFAGSSTSITTTAFTLSAGSFTSTTGTLSVSDDFTYSGGTADFSSSTLALSSATSKTISAGNIEFDNLKFNSGGNRTVSGSLNVNGTLTLNSGYPIAAGTINAKGDIVASDSSTSSTVTVVANGTSSQAISASAGKCIPNFTINSSGGTVSFTSDITICKNFTYTAGTVDLLTSNFTFTTNTANTIAAGNLNFNGVTFTNGSTSTISGSLNVNGTLTLNSGYPIAAGTINAKGDIVASDSSTSSTVTVVANGTSSQAISASAGKCIPNFTINSSGGTVSFTSDITICKDFTYTAGAVDFLTSNFTFTTNTANTIAAGNLNFNGVTFTNGSTSTISGSLNVNGTLTLNSNYPIAAGTINAKGDIVVSNSDSSSSASINLNGTGAQTISQTPSETIPGGVLTINKTAGTVTLASHLTLNKAGQDLTLTDGDLNMAGYNLTVSNSSGTDNVLTLASGTTIYTGCGTITAETTTNNGSIISGSSTYLSVNDPAAVTEGTNSVFTVSLDAANCANVVFNYATSSGTATSGTDFTSTSGTATITAGQSSTTVTVPTTNDSVYEGGTSETFNLDLTSITNTAVTDNSGVGSIDDNESTPVVEFSSTSSSGSEASGANTMAITLTPVSAFSTVFTYALSGTATGSGTDYTESSSSPLTIAAGSSTSTVGFSINNDTTVESDETIIATLSSPTNANLGTNTTHTFTIADDDIGAFTISGITGGSDVTQDAYLTSGLTAVVTWGASAGADEYDVTIYENDGTTVKCATSTETTTSKDFSACTLTAGTNYKAKVQAYNTARTKTAVATNSLYAFNVNQAPVIASGGNGPWYVLSGGSIVIDANWAAAPSVGVGTDADGDTLTFSAVGTPSGGVGSATNNTSSVTYSPSTYTGVDTFTFTLSDGKGGTVSGTMTIHVVTAYTWTGGGANSLFATAANWCGAVNTNKTGCDNSGSAPNSTATATHIAIFDGTCASNCSPTLGAHANMYGLQLNSGYSGTFTQSSTYTIGVGLGDFTQAAGTFTGGSGNIVITGNGAWFTLSGGTFNSTSGLLDMVGTALTISGGTFNPGTGTLRIAYNGATTTNTGATVFNHVVLGGGASGAHTVTGTLNMSGDLTLNASSSSTFAGGTIRTTGANINATGTAFNGGSGLIVVAGSSNQTITGTAGVLMPNLRIESTGGSVSLAGTIDVAGAFTEASGSITPGTSTLRFVENSSNTFSFGSTVYNNINFNGGASGGFDLSGTTLKVGGTLAFAGSGSGDSLDNGVIEARGAINLTSGSYDGTATIRVAGSTDQTITGASSTIAPNFEIVSTGGNVNLAGTIALGGTFVYSTGNVVPGTSTLKFAAGAAATPNGLTVQNVMYAASSTLTGTLNVSGNATFTATTSSDLNGTGTINLSGNLTSTAFGGGTATIRLVGASQTITGTNSNSGLPKLTIDSTSGTATFVGTIVPEGNFTHVSGAVDFTTNTSAISFRNANSITSPGSSTPFYDVYFSGTGTSTLLNPMYVSRHMTFNRNTSSNLNGSTMYVRGDLTITTNQATGTTEIVLDGTGTQTINQGVNGKIPGTVLTINKASGSVELATALTINKAGADLTLTGSSVINMNGFNITVSNSSGTDNVLTVGVGCTINLEGGTITAESTVNNGTIN